MHIKDIMTNIVHVATPDTAVANVATMMREGNFGSVPVAEQGRMIGMITDRDIVLRCIAEGLDPAGMTAEQCMSPRILYCHDSDTVADVLRNMGEQAVRRLPVIDAQKRLVGIVSIGDLSAACPDKSVSGEAMNQIRRTRPDPLHSGQTRVIPPVFRPIDATRPEHNAAG